jgi:predicted DNA-binding antitoxin AbrB/MazE fold protein
MIDCRARYEGGALRLLSNRVDLDEGELVTVQIERDRSGPSHRHQFAWVREAWAGLPEDCRHEVWAETPETLRKHALIATGYHQTTVIDCGDTGVALDVKAALVAAEWRAHGYAIGQVRGPVVRIWTPESQSIRAMGNDMFQASKAAILEWIAGKLGVSPEELRGAA